MFKKINIKLLDLNSISDLKKIDKYFLNYLSLHNSQLFKTIINYRIIGSDKLFSSLYSKFIIELGPLLDNFIVSLFRIKSKYFLQKKNIINLI